ncbi:MAG: DNA polymerase III subunit chi [Methylotenera sp. RIFCSPLOWO2_02_FULL_45_14]|nr:MAG: DNA polymerase III subunit chi [Methylotenera sp. RIFCSPLOWO2_02_FULL_45_14]
MTRVEFFFNVPDKLVKVAELCEKAVAKGRQLTIFTQHDAMGLLLQQRLWQQSAPSFLPSTTPFDTVSQFVPIIIDADGEHLIQDDILINLQTVYPPFFSRFRVLVELVGVDEDDKAAARSRFKFYRDRGYQVKSTDVASSQPASIRNV